MFLQPPGLRKTSLAHIYIKKMGVNFKSISWPTFSKAAELAAILTNLQENDVLFIHGIHRLDTNIEEILYPVMEDFSLDIIREGPTTRSIRINLPKFTLIGVTTRLGVISNPLRDRLALLLGLIFIYSCSQTCYLVTGN